LALKSSYAPLNGATIILLCEQYYDFAEELADHYLVMERGFSSAQEPPKNWGSCSAQYLLHAVGRNCSWRNVAKLNRKCRIEICLRPKAPEKSTFSLSSNCHIERKSLVSEQGYFYSAKKHLLKNAAQVLAISPLSGCAFSSHCCRTQE